jgi:Cytochrome D1 heme domain
MIAERAMTTVLGLVLLAAGAAAAGAHGTIRGTGDLGIVVERASGSVQVIETTGHTSLCTVEGLGDLSHASAVFIGHGEVHIIPATAETSGHGTTGSQAALYADRLATFLAGVPKM